MYYTKYSWFNNALMEIYALMKVSKFKTWPIQEQDGGDRGWQWSSKFFYTV